MPYFPKADGSKHSASLERNLVLEQQLNINIKNQVLPAQILDG